MSLDESDEDLVRRARFERIYAATYEPILGYALRRTATAEDASDVVAETFAIAWRRLAEVPELPQARLWLFGVARRVVANYRRGQRRYERLGARLRATSTTAPAVTTETATIAAAGEGSGIAAAFGRLGESDRDLLGLLAWEGLRAAEIAQVLGCSTGAVRVRVYRARARFARELAVEHLDL